MSPRGVLPAVSCALLIPICLVIAVTGLLAGASPARAKVEPSWESSLRSIEVDAELFSDGSLHVVDRRGFRRDSLLARRSGGISWSFPCDGSDIGFAGWEFPNAPRFTWSVNEVCVDGVPVQKVDFRESWLQPMGDDVPPMPSYSLVEEDGYLHVYVFDTDEDSTVTLDYTARGLATRWRDCGELYWSAIWDAGRGRPESSMLVLPASEGSQDDPADSIRLYDMEGGNYRAQERLEVKAPAGGTVSVSYPADITETSTLYPELERVYLTFPPDWLDGMRQVDGSLTEGIELHKQEQEELERRRQEEQNSPDSIVELFGTMIIGGPLIAVMLWFFAECDEANRDAERRAELAELYEGRVMAMTRGERAAAEGPDGSMGRRAGSAADQILYNGLTQAEYEQKQLREDIKAWYTLKMLLNQQIKMYENGLDNPSLSDEVHSMLEHQLGDLYQCYDCLISKDINLYFFGNTNQKFLREFLKECFSLVGNDKFFWHSSRLSLYAFNTKKSIDEIESIYPMNDFLCQYVDDLGIEALDSFRLDADFLKDNGLSDDEIDGLLGGGGRSWNEPR